MRRVRLDDELVAQGICLSRADALRLLMAGDVSARGERLTSAGMLVEPGLELHVKGRGSYVGRGGVKLAGALDAFGLDPAGLRCLDIGCSTGGFTDCLLKRGASSVVAVDVGRAQFDWVLRNDTRVELLERTNARDLPQLGYRGCFDLVVCDVSFTSVGALLPAVLDVLEQQGRFLTLLKPQFEAKREQVADGGVVRDPRVWAECVGRYVRLFADFGLYPVDACASPIHGAKGNREFFLLGDAGWGACPLDALDSQVEQLMRKACEL